MRRKIILGLLTLLGASGCEDPAVVSVGKPPPGGGGPREIAFVQSGCIRAMAVDGSNVATILCPAGGVLVADVSWEPSGAAVAYTNYTTTEPGLWRVNADGTNKIRLLDAEQCGVAGVARCDAVDWSPLGDEIAVIKGPSDPGVDPAVLLVPATGCPWPDPMQPCPQVLYTEPASGGGIVAFSGIAWSPDGARLATRNGGGSIILIERATGTASSLHAFSGGVSDWGRGPRATTLVLARFTGSSNDLDIYLFDVANPSVAPQLTVQRGRHPTFSADGAFIAYQEMTGAFYTVKRQLDTGARTVLIKGGLHPDWRKPAQ